MQPHPAFSPTELLREFDSLWQKSQWYAALHRVASLYNCSNDEHCAELIRVLDTVQSMDAEVTDAAIIQGFTRDVERVNRIVSIGDRYDDDEILLVLTIRIQLDLLMALFRDRAHRLVYLLPLDLLTDTDELLMGLLTRPEMRNRVRILCRQIQRNWGCPITSFWLSCV